MAKKTFEANGETLEQLALLVARLAQAHQTLAQAQNKSFGAGVVSMFAYDEALEDVQSAVSLLFEAKDLIDPEDFELERREAEGEEDEDEDEEGDDEEEEDDDEEVSSGGNH